jgi:hypothetical protein
MARPERATGTVREGIAGSLLTIIGRPQHEDTEVPECQCDTLKPL